MLVLVSSTHDNFLLLFLSALVTCVESGLLKVWKEGSTDTVSALRTHSTLVVLRFVTQNALDHLLCAHYINIQNRESEIDWI